MTAAEPTDPEPAGLHVHRERVRGEWIDYNGHLNVAYYTLIFDHAVDAFLEAAGITADHRAATGGSIFAAEAHISYARELVEGAEARVETQLLAFDAKRVHLFQRMYDDASGELAATHEVLELYVDLNVRRVAEMPAGIAGRLDRLKRAHDQAAGWPEEAGRAIRGVPARGPSKTG
jgi:acyl-CoA thioester hydrolase